MDAKKQTKKEKEQPISPLSQELTYGERWHDFIFKHLINFWLNWIASGLFTYWVMHYQRPVNLGVVKLPSPSMMQNHVAAFFYKLWPMAWFGDRKTFDVHNPPTTPRGEAASTAATTFTLVGMGHPIMIGSVWLGAKFKAPIVKWFNRRHYGDEAMQSDDLQARHAAIEMEERPTFLGAVVGRLGTILATQLATYTVGNPKNIIHRAGINFSGVDHIAGVVGNNVGAAVTELLPNTMARVDSRLAANGQYSWSAKQLQATPALKGATYGNAVQHLSKYYAQDLMYTFITSLSISPVINAMKHVIPGLTYTPKVQRKDEASDPIIAEKAANLRVTPNPIAERAEAADAMNDL